MKALAIDTETTGLPLHPAAPEALQPRVIEFAGIKFTKDGERMDWDWLCNPHRKLEPIITKITGLRDEDLADQPSFDEYVDELIAFFADVDVLIAHNAPFDMFLLWLDLKRAGRAEDWRWPPVTLCTAQLYSEVYGYRPKLQDLHRDITGKEITQTHRAIDDAELLMDIILQEKTLELIPPIKNQDGIYIPQELCASGFGG